MVVLPALAGRKGLAVQLVGEAKEEMGTYAVAAVAVEQMVASDGLGGQAETAAMVGVVPFALSTPEGRKSNSSKPSL